MPLNIICLIKIIGGIYLNKEYMKILIIMPRVSRSPIEILRFYVKK